MDKKQQHHTVMDYLRWRGDLTFTADPFNEVDQLILCIIAYLNFRRFPSLKTMKAAEATPLHTLAPLMRSEDEQQGLSQLEYLPLLRAAANSRRFGDVGIFGYVTEHDIPEEKQFDAVSFVLPDKTIFCAFMGTDLSIIGWKEDLNLSFLDTVPAQRRAVEYVEAIAAANRSRLLRIGGHSKGGNLALYAALNASQRLQRRILAVYNNDGPGFAASPWEGEGYLSMAERIHSYIPAESIVGVLLEQQENYTVVHSDQHFLLQHEPMSWSVMGNRFVSLPQRSPLGQLSERLVKAWVTELSIDERRAFVDALYELLHHDGRYTTLEEVWQHGGELLRHYRESEAEKTAIHTAIDRFTSLWKEEMKRHAEKEMKEVRQGMKETADALRRRLLEKKKK